ncbi:MAG: aminotransferase class V-fold PLP-dependent enzyme [Suipraeoptans sp.]
MIYLDNAATTMKKPSSVIKAVTQAMTSFGNAGRGASSASLDAARTIYNAREAVSRFFSVNNPRQVVFTSNSTQALNMAIRGILVPGDHVVTTILEHNSVLRPLYEMEENGVEVTFVDSDNKGNISYKDIEDAIRSNTKLIVTTHASNLTGNVLDVNKIGEIAKANNVLYAVDASQTAGVFPINFNEMNIDLLAFTGHKGLLGPQGTGGLCVREGVELKPIISGGTGIQTFSKTQPKEMPSRLEAGTLNAHGIAGLLAGIEYIESEGIDKIREKEQELMLQFYDGVKKIDGIKFYGDFDTNIRCPIVSLNFKEYDSAEVSDELLSEYGIATRSGGHCAPLMHERFGTGEQGMVRFSFSHFNTNEEVSMAASAVKQIAL